MRESARQLESFLNLCLARKRRAEWLRALLLLGLAVIAALLIAMGYVALGGTPGALWALLFGPVLAASLGVLVWLAFQQSRASSRSLAPIARLVETAAPGLRGKLINAHELTRAPVDARRWSPDLVAALADSVAEQLRGLPPETVVPWRPLRRLLGSVLASALVLAATGSIAPEAANAMLAALAAPFASSGETASEDAPLLVGDLSAMFEYPAYTGIPPRSAPGTTGNLSALPGTMVTLKGRLLKPGRSLRVVQGEIETPASLVKDEVTVRFPIKQAGTWRFVLTTGMGRDIPGREHAIALEEDRVPGVELQGLTDGMEVNGNERLELYWRADDDFGLTRAELKYADTEDGEPESIPLDGALSGKEAGGSYVWDLSILKPSAGQDISVYVEAADNDTVNGPKAGRSQVFRIKVFNPREHHEKVIERIRSVWEKMVTNLAHRLERPVDASMDNAAAKLAIADSRKLGAAEQEILDELNEIRLMLADDEFVEDDLRNAVANVRSDMLAQAKRHDQNLLAAERSAARGFVQAAAQVHADNQEGVANLEKNIIYLDDMIDRQRVDELLSKAEELGRARENLNNLLQKYRNSPDEAVKQELLREINRLRKKMDELANEMQKLAKGVRDEYLNPDALEKSGAKNALDDLEKMLNEGDLEKAASALERMAEAMERTVAGLRETQQRFGEEEYAEENHELEKVAQQLDQAIEEQERIVEGQDRVTERQIAKSREAMGGDMEQFINRQLKRAEQIRESVEQSQTDPRNNYAGVLKNEALERLAELETMLGARDLMKSKGAAEKLMDKLSVARDVLPGMTPQGASNPSEDLNEAVSQAQAIHRDLSEVMPKPGQGDPQQNEMMKQMAGRQRELEDKAREVARQLNELQQKAPLMGDDAMNSMNDAMKSMRNSTTEMERNNPMEARQHGRGALENLKQLRNMMQGEDGQDGQGGGQPGQARGGKPAGMQRGARGMPRPMGASPDAPGERRGGRMAGSKEKIVIPGRDSKASPKEFRKDIMDAMKQGAPDEYAPKLKKYYEGLVK